MPPIPMVTLNNGVRIPQLGLGVYLLSDDEMSQTVNVAFKNGYRLIDTASFYNNEKAVGIAIRNSQVPREEIFVTTKLWNTDQGYDRAFIAFETSLKKLGLDYIDLYLLHWPCPMKGLTIETWKALEKIYKEGRAKAIGVCNFKPTHLERLLQETEIVPAILQIEIHPTFIQEEVRKYAKQHNIQVESWHPLGGHKCIQELLSIPLFAKLGKKYGKTPAQIILHWHTQLGIIVIPKSSHPERIKENCNIFDFELSPEDVSAISALDKGQRLGPDPDTYSGD
jgi:2,5-diketo-D-gluconate reductase A